MGLFDIFKKEKRSKSDDEKIENKASDKLNDASTEPEGALNERPFDKNSSLSDITEDRLCSEYNALLSQDTEDELDEGITIEDNLGGNFYEDDFWKNFYNGARTRREIDISIEEIYELIFSREATAKYMFNGRTTKRYEFPSLMADGKWRDNDTEKQHIDLIDWED